jgi:hypothetical protein
MTFWSNTLKIASPTRQFRFKVTNGTNWWWVSSCSKPSYEVSSEEYKLINHKFKYPGVVTWNDVTISMVDTNDNTKALYQSLVFGGYDPRAIIPKEGLSKRLLNNQTKVLSDSLRDEPKAESGSLLKIVQLNAEGNAVETWTLVNPFIKSTNFGQLDYSSDELVKLELVIVYDYALLE